MDRPVVVSVIPPTGGEANARCERPWGWYETLAVGEGYLIKRIHIEPGARLSLQRHRHRSEQWLILGGQGRVRIGEQERAVRSGDALVVPLGAVHRAAAGSGGLDILEVQRGEHLSEEDIERLEDDYGRLGAGAAPR